MLIPLGTDRPLARTTLVTHALIGLNVLLYVVDSALRSANPEHALGPIGQALSLSRQSMLAHPWTILGYAFAHAGIWHILGNMLFLWVFGPNVEDRFGRLGFLAFYLLGGIAAGGAHLLTQASPVVGASGAIAAVTGAYAVLFPKTIIRCFLFFIMMGVINIPALWFIGFAIARDIFSLGGQGSVAIQAHLGGYAFGGVTAFVLLGTKILPREPYDMFQMFRQSKRRAELRAAVQDSERVQKSKRSSAIVPVPEEAVLLRAQVSSAISSGDLALAADHYRRLVGAYSANPPAVLLSRQNMLLMANQFFASGDPTRAAETYERFLSGYPSDPETPHIKLMLGLIRVRYLNQPQQARPLIVEAADGVHDEQHAQLARELLAELDASPA